LQCETNIITSHLQCETNIIISTSLTFSSLMATDIILKSSTITHVIILNWNTVERTNQEHIQNKIIIFVSHCKCEILFYFVILHPDFTTIKLLNMSFVLVLNNHPIRTLDIYVIQCSDRLFFFSASTKFQMAKWSVYLNNNLRHTVW
jgi:hypothetical protein